MSKNKYEVNVKWYEKILVVFLMLFAAVNYMDTYNMAPTLAWLVYTLLFIYLAVNGTNSKIGRWIGENSLFRSLFFMPTVICAMYSILFLVDQDSKTEIYLSAFAVFLTVLSIPLALLLMRFQGGIRRRSALYAFLGFPFVLYFVCKAFAEQSFLIAAVVSGVIAIVCFIISVINYSNDHHADYASADDKAERGDYKAVWESRPDSEVRNNVIHLRGTIVIQYYGDYYNKDRANELANSLIQSYVHRVHSEMKGYSINSASVTIKSQRMG